VADGKRPAALGGDVAERAGVRLEVTERLERRVRERIATGAGEDPAGSAVAVEVSRWRLSKELDMKGMEALKHMKTRFRAAGAAYRAARVRLQ
jgi:hypothetical protein